MGSLWRRLLAIVVVLGAVILGACSKNDPAEAALPTEPARIVDFYLSGDELRSLGEITPETDGAASKPTPSASVLPWTFTAPDGRVLASGTTPDVRSASSELGPNGEPPFPVNLPWMIFSLRLPTAEGTLDLHQPRPAAPDEESVSTNVSPRDVPAGSGLLASLGLHRSGAECSRDPKPCDTDAQCSAPGCPRSCHNGQCVSQCEGLGGTEHKCTGIFDCISNAGQLDSKLSCSGAPGDVGTRCCNLNPKAPGTYSLEDLNAFGSNLQNIRPAKTSCPVNVLMLPEAYQDQSAFRARAATLADSLRQDKDWARAADSISFWTADFFSHDTRITDPDAKLVQHTAFNVTFGTGERRRALTIQSLDPEVANKLIELIRKTNADLLMILVNTREHGGIASSILGVRYVTASDENVQPAVLGHELGHAALGLNDEYSYGTCDMRYVESPNTSAHRDSPPWKDMMGTQGVGAYEGAAYCKTGVYRPTHNCRMNDFYTNKTFCPVCARELEKDFPTSQPDPNSGSLTTPGGTRLLNGSTSLTCRRGVPLR
jgi:hypothetical protein